MEDVAIFWDYENCPAPTNASGYAIVNNIRSVAQPYGSVKSLRAYLGITEQFPVPRTLTLRSELQSSGVSLVDCPHNGRKDVADKMIIVDMLAHAIDNPAPSTIVLITGDRDFAYAMSILRLRRYRIILVTLPNAHASLTAQASICMNWADIILNPIEQHSRNASNQVGQFSRAPSFRNNVPPFSPSPRPPYNFGEAENVERNEQADVMPQYLRQATHRRTSDASSSTFVGHPPRYERPRQDISSSSSLEVDSGCGYSRPGSTTVEQPNRASSSSVSSSTTQSNPPYLAQNQGMTVTSGVVYSSVPAIAHSAHSFPSAETKTGLVPTPMTNGTNGGNSSVQVIASPIIQRPQEPLAMSQPDMQGDSMKVMQPRVQNCPPMRPASAPAFLPSPSPLPAVLSTQQVSASATTPSPSAKPVEVVIPPVPTSQPQSPDPQPRPNGRPNPSAPINIPPPKPAIIPPPKPAIIPPPKPAIIPPPKPAIIPPPKPPIIVPPNFRALVQYLQTQRSQGDPRPLRLLVSRDINKNALTYKNAGVSKFKEYAALAEKQGIIEVGGRERMAWISLKPEWREATLT